MWGRGWVRCSANTARWHQSQHWHQSQQSQHLLAPPRPPSHGVPSTHHPYPQPARPYPSSPKQLALDSLGGGGRPEASSSPSQHRPRCPPALPLPSYARSPMIPIGEEDLPTPMLVREDSRQFWGLVLLRVFRLLLGDELVWLNLWAGRAHSRQLRSTLHFSRSDTLLLPCKRRPLPSLCGLCWACRATRLPSLRPSCPPAGQHSAAARAAPARRPSARVPGRVRRGGHVASDRRGG